MEIRKLEEAACEAQKKKDEEKKEENRFQEIMKQREKKLNRKTKPYEITSLEKKDDPGKESGFCGPETTTTNRAKWAKRLESLLRINTRPFLKRHCYLGSS